MSELGFRAKNHRVTGGSDSGRERSKSLFTRRSGLLLERIVYFRVTMEQVIEQYLRAYPGKEVESIKRAYAYALRKHNGQTRASGLPYIEHPLAVALEVAKRGYGRKVIIASLLHDVIEDCGVTILEIRELFGAAIAKKVALLTKPKWFDGRWVWANQREYYTMEQREQDRHEERAREHYKRIISSGDMDVIVIKFFDGKNNLEEMGSLPPWKRTRNVGTLVERILWLAPRILSADDYFALVSEMQIFGREIPESLLPKKPEGKVVVLPSRGKLDLDLLIRIPPPTPDYVSLYWGNDEFELGFPTVCEQHALGVLLRVFERHEIRRTQSLVAPGVGAHEVLFRISRDRMTLEEAGTFATYAFNEIL
ncbi:MAG: HD domain-containing protein [Candidatus ainarchaeum sp.]|nr:HD domain-containing protein [Candidatus ainarchaeum sp.]